MAIRRPGWHCQISRRRYNSSRTSQARRQQMAAPVTLEIFTDYV
jgi:hypothetical protein